MSMCSNKMIQLGERIIPKSCPKCGLGPCKEDFTNTQIPVGPPPNTPSGVQPPKNVMGCICPPGSNIYCENPLCPRKSTTLYVHGK